MAGESSDLDDVSGEDEDLDDAREGEGFAGQLSRRQRVALRRVRARLAPRLDHPRFTDALVLRFLRAKRFEVDGCAEMLERHLAYRERRGLDLPTEGCWYGLGPAEAAFPELPALKRFYPHGFHKVDRLGRPVYIERLGHLEIGPLLREVPPARITQYFAHESERQTMFRLPACSLAKGSLVQTSLTILDLNGLGFGLLSNRQALQTIRTIISEQGTDFPEISDKTVIVNAPAAFSGIFAAIRPLLSASMLERLEVFRSGHESRLMELIAPEDLPEFLGGRCRCSGGCLERQPGPWCDPVICGALAEQPHWEVMRRFVGGGGPVAATPARGAAAEEAAAAAPAGAEGSLAGEPLGGPAALGGGPGPESAPALPGAAGPEGSGDRAAAARACMEVALVAPEGASGARSRTTSDAGTAEASAAAEGAPEDAAGAAGSGGGAACAEGVLEGAAGAAGSSAAAEGARGAAPPAAQEPAAAAAAAPAPRLAAAPPPESAAAPDATLDPAAGANVAAAVPGEPRAEGAEGGRGAPGVDSLQSLEGTEAAAVAATAAAATTVVAATAAAAAAAADAGLAGDARAEADCVGGAGDEAGFGRRAGAEAEHVGDARAESDLEGDSGAEAGLGGGAAGADLDGDAGAEEDLTGVVTWLDIESDTGVWLRERASVVAAVGWEAIAKMQAGVQGYLQEDPGPPGEAWPPTSPLQGSLRLAGEDFADGRSPPRPDDLGSRCGSSIDADGYGDDDHDAAHLGPSACHGEAATGRTTPPSPGDTSGTAEEAPMDRLVR